MGLFGKKEACPVCGGEVKGLFHKKIGGKQALCKDCSAQISMAKELLKNATAEYVKEHYVSDYDQSVLEDIEKKAMQTGSKKPASVSDPDPSDDELEGDEMLPAAVDVILETGQASVSMLQRRLKLGYARAARIVDEMEEKGIVGPFQGSKPRSILITKEQWEARKNGGVQMDFDDLAEKYPESYDQGVPEEI